MELKFNPDNKIVPIHVMRAIAVQWPPAHRAFLANRHYRRLYDHTIGGTRELLTRGGEVEWEVVINTNSRANGEDDGERRIVVTRVNRGYSFWPHTIRISCNVRRLMHNALTSVAIYDKGVQWRVEFSGGSVWNLERNEHTIIGAKTRYWVAPHLIEARKHIVNMARCLLRMAARVTCVLADIPPLAAPSLLVLGCVVAGGERRYLRMDKGDLENIDSIIFKGDFERFPNAVTNECPTEEANDTATTLSPSTPINPMTATSSTASPTSSESD